MKARQGAWLFFFLACSLSLPGVVRSVRPLQRVRRERRTEETSTSKSGKGKSDKNGKGKSDSDSSSTTTGKNGKGKNGGKGKGKSGNPGECVCNGLTTLKYVDRDTLVDLGVRRLRNLAGAAVTTPDTLPPLTYALAHSLAPPTCHLVAVDGDADVAFLTAIIADDPTASTGWVGVTKDLQAAYFDAIAGDLEHRRDGWTHVATGGAVDETLWQANQPPALSMTASPTEAAYTAVWQDDGLVATRPSTDQPGAFYECCAEVLPACFTSGTESLDDVLLPILMAADA